MAFRFVAVSKDEYEVAAPTNTKKETKFGSSVFTGRKKKIFLLNLKPTKSWKMIPETVSVETINKPWLSDVFYLQKDTFWFYPTNLVNTKTTIPLRVGSLR